MLHQIELKPKFEQIDGVKMTLFEECIIALGGNAVVLSEKETVTVFDSMIAEVPMTRWGRIDWCKFEHAIQLATVEDVLKYVDISNDEVHILWDNDSLPSIRTHICKIIDAIDDVVAVSFDTWVYCSGKYIIEIYHEDEIYIGWLKQTTYIESK